MLEVLIRFRALKLLFPSALTFCSSCTQMVWGMERGNLTGTVPTEIGQLENLIFIDLDYNILTGTLPPELYNLVNLTQLDLNNNMFEGGIDGIESLQELEFLQLHSNMFNGTVPTGMGAFSQLGTFTLHGSTFSGTIPTEVCDLVDGGSLTSLIADCGGVDPDIECSCCTYCRV